MTAADDRSGTAGLDRLQIEPRGPIDARPIVPGSKSITNRVLLLAALADGESRLRGGLESDDTVVMRRALESMGIGLQLERDPTTGAEDWRVCGRGGRFQAPGHPLDCGNSGTTVRFLTAALTLAEAPIVVDGLFKGKCRVQFRCTPRIPGAQN